MQARLIPFSLSVMLALGLAAGAAGCASTDTPAGAQGKTVSKNVEGVEEKSVITGSRIPTKTTEKLVKSTTQDKADEPIRSIGNTVGFKGN
jgi:hypothetical protein